MRKHVFQIYTIFFASLIFVIIGCSIRQLHKVLQPKKRKPFNYALFSHGAKAKASSESPGHPAFAAIDGDTSSERGWREWGDARRDLLPWTTLRGDRWVRFYDVFADLEWYHWTERGKQQAYKQKLRESPTLTVFFSQKTRIDTVIIYTIDSDRYPATEYGINTYWLRCKKGKVFKTILKVKNNKQGKRIHRFKPVYTDAIQVKVIETNQIVRLRHDSDHPIRQIYKKVFARNAQHPSKTEQRAKWEFYLQEMPSPLKYVSQIVELEAYGPSPPHKPSGKPEENEFKTALDDHWTGEGHFESYTDVDVNRLELDEVSCILAEAKDVWFGMQGGLGHFNKSTERWAFYSPTEPQNESLFPACLAREGTRIWVPMNQKKKMQSDTFDVFEVLYTFETDTKTWNRVTDVPSSMYSRFGSANSIVVHKNKIWLGGQHGTVWYDRKKGHLARLRKIFFRKPSTPKGKVRKELGWVERPSHIAEDIDGRSIWITLGSRFIFKHDGDDVLDFTQPGTEMTLSSDIVDYFGFNVNWPFLWYVISPIQWLSSRDRYRQGHRPMIGIEVANLDYVLPYDYGIQDIRRNDFFAVPRPRHTVRTYYPADGIVGHEIYDVAEDGDFVWVVTDQGTSRLNLITDRWQSYTTEDGLLDKEVLLVSASDSDVWFATKNGISRFIKHKTKSKEKGDSRASSSD